MLSIRHILHNASKKTLAVYLMGVPLALFISFLIFNALSAHKDDSNANPQLTNDIKQLDRSAEEEHTNRELSQDKTTATDVDNTSAAVDNTPMSKPSTPTYRPFECKNIPIPKKIEYINDDSMPEGATRTISTGQDGYYTSCTTDSTGYTPPTNGTRIEPVNDLVAIETGLDEQRQQQAAAEDAARTQQYYINLSNCIQNLKAQGMQPSSAESRCRSIIRR